jgi:hypothetical protein
VRKKIRIATFSGMVTIILISLNSEFFLQEQIYGIMKNTLENGVRSKQKVRHWNFHCRKPNSENLPPTALTNTLLER